MNGESKTQPIDWDYIITKIKEGKCLLVLGQEAFNHPGEKNIQEQLLEALQLGQSPFVKRYYENENLFLFGEKSHRTQFCHAYKNFYRKQQPSEVIRLLADIPFHVYLTLTPDMLLVDAFRNKNYLFQHGFYKKNTDPQPIKNPNADQPLIYNMFGCIENEESLILSHNDLYDYFKSIFKRQSMPTQLKDELSGILNIIFLGVSFEKWYLQILLRELEIHNQEFAFTRFASTMIPNPNLSSFCQEQFKIQFIDENIVEFVKELHQRIQNDADLPLRAGVEKKMDVASSIREFIGNGNLDAALETLAEALDGTGFQDEMDKLMGRFGRLKKRRIANVLTSQDIELEEAKITEAILELMKLAKL